MISQMKCGAIALIAAPVLALIFFGLEPGGLVIDNVDADNLAEETRLKIEALSSNAFMAHLSAYVVPLSLAFALFGMWIVESDSRGRGESSAVWRAGLMLLAITITGWVTSQSLTHQIANTGLESGPDQATANALYAVDVGHNPALRSVRRAGLLLLLHGSGDSRTRQQVGVVDRRRVLGGVVGGDARRYVRAGAVPTDAKHRLGHLHRLDGMAGPPGRPHATERVAARPAPRTAVLS